MFVTEDVAAAPNWAVRGWPELKVEAGALAAPVESRSLFGTTSASN